MTGFVGQVKRGPKKEISFPTLPLPHPGPEIKRVNQPWAVSRGLPPMSLSSPCVTLALAERAVNNSNVLFTQVHNAHIRCFANRRGKTPFLPLEISLET